METFDLLKSGQLAGCKELKISAGLSEFPIEVFELADSLELLVLSNNCLSKLPDGFGRLKKLKAVFFNNNEFEAFPAVLAECPNLSMISFKGNRIRQVGLGALSPAIRWLILTDNQLQALPADIGRLSKLQKLMLAGNQLQALPEEMAACQNLELIRLSANRLKEIPGWLFSLPRLSWLAYAGNPCCNDHGSAGQTMRSRKPLLAIDRNEIQLKDILGQGASGVIYKSLWMVTDAEPEVVAVKLFKGEVTSDGLPQDEMRACVAAGHHPNLVNVIAELGNSEQAGLVFSFVSPDYKNLGDPPSLDTCTRDTYDAEVSFTLPVVLRILKGIAAVIAHIHSRGIMHGDLYAHNILIDEAGESILGDFGAASLYDPADVALDEALQRLESRAFGCLIEDLLDRCSTKEGDAYKRLCQLQHSCMQPMPAERPLFSAICETLQRADG